MAMIEDSGISLTDLLFGHDSAMSEQQQQRDLMSFNNATELQQHIHQQMEDGEDDFAEYGHSPNPAALLQTPHTLPVPSPYEQPTPSHTPYGLPAVSPYDATPLLHPQQHNPVAVSLDVASELDALLAQPVAEETSFDAMLQQQQAMDHQHQLHLQNESRQQALHQQQQQLAIQEQQLLIQQQQIHQQMHQQQQQQAQSMQQQTRLAHSLHHSNSLPARPAAATAQFMRREQSYTFMPTLVNSPTSNPIMSTPQGGNTLFSSPIVNIITPESRVISTPYQGVQEPAFNMDSLLGELASPMVPTAADCRTPLQPWGTEEPSGQGPILSLLDELESEIKALQDEGQSGPGVLDIQSMTGIAEGAGSNRGSGDDAAMGKLMTALKVVRARRSQGQLRPYVQQSTSNATDSSHPRSDSLGSAGGHEVAGEGSAFNTLLAPLSYDALRAPIPSSQQHQQQQQVQVQQHQHQHQHQQVAASPFYSHFASPAPSPAVPAYLSPYAPTIQPSPAPIAFAQSTPYNMTPVSAFTQAPATHPSVLSFLSPYSTVSASPAPTFFSPYSVAESPAPSDFIGGGMEPEAGGVDGILDLLRGTDALNPTYDTGRSSDMNSHQHEYTSSVSMQQQTHVHVVAGTTSVPILASITNQPPTAPRRRKSSNFMASLAASSSTSSTSSTASPSSLATSTTTATSSSTTTLVNPDDHHSSLSPSANNGSLSVTPPSTPRSYKCEFDGCGKVFTRMYNLKSHAKAHTGARPYACPACPITFLRKHDMKRHFASLHDAEKQYKCPNCGAGFARTDALRRHMDVEARMSRGELTEMDLTAMGEGTAAVAAEPLVTTALETSAVPA